MRPPPDEEPTDPHLPSSSRAPIPTAADPPDELLGALRTAWGVAPGAPLLVIGQLREVRTAEDASLFFLELLEHPESGVGLVYPGQSDRGPAKAFVVPIDARPFKGLPSPWAIAELELSPAAHRARHHNPYECTVRRGSLRALHDLPEAWTVRLTGAGSVRRMSQAAFASIQAEHDQQRAGLEDAHRQALADHAQAAARAERLSRQINDMNQRLLRLSDLMTERSARLLALGLIDESDLLALQLGGMTPAAQPAHDFEQLLGADFARLALFVQARLWQAGMLFTQAQLRDFLALLRTHDMVVLAGDSGSGKTSLVRYVAESIGGRCTVIPVKPNWTGPEDLLGYYNPIERRYQPTAFLQALQAAHAEPELLHFICLDEMNLARVEYYFSDFLSLLEKRSGSPQIPLYASDEERHVLMESGLFLSIEAEVRSRLGLPGDTTLEDLLLNEEANAMLHRLGGFKDAESVLLHHARLRRSLAAITRTPTSLNFPPNVRIIGAVNVDETTHYLSPKVLDRVHVLRFRNPVLVDWDAVAVEVESFDVDLALPVRISAAQFGAREDYPPFDRGDPDAAFLAGLARRQLDPMGIEFGLRAIRQSLHYLRQARIAGIAHPAALNNVMLHKVLPKLILDASRTAADGRPRREILLALRADVAAALPDPAGADVVESCVAALDQLIAAADGNSGIANFWLR